MFNRLKKMYVNSVARRNTVFSFSREQQIKIIEKYPIPKDLIERSYFQYKVQKEMLGIKSIFYEIVSPFLVAINLIFLNRNKETETKCDLVCFLSGTTEDMVPDKLVRKYKHVKYYYADGKKNLDSFDRKWFFQNIIMRYPFSFFYHLKILVRLSEYSYMYNKFLPKAIANHFEYSCSCSAMTKYCHDRGMKHMNFMHGEKLWYIRDSFFKFDECYIWDEHYAKLFMDLKADKNQFIIDIPPKFVIDRKARMISGDNKQFDFCYYFANETKEEVTKIIEELTKLKNKGYFCKVRLHPRWGDHDYIMKSSNESGIVVEDNSIDINDSILSTDNIISLFSTVIFQGNIARKKIVIDDLTNPKKYSMLKDLDYIAFSFPHILFSELMD